MKTPTVRFSEELITKATKQLMLIMAQSDEGEITIEMLSTAYLDGYYDGMTKVNEMIRERTK